MLSWLVKSSLQQSYDDEDDEEDDDVILFLDDGNINSTSVFGDEDFCLSLFLVFWVLLFLFVFEVVDCKSEFETDDIDEELDDEK